MFVTFFDTCMVSLAAMFVWRISPFFVFPFWLVIACFDGTYLSAVLTKVPDGAWFTLTLAAVLASILLLWRFGKENQWLAEAEDRFPTTHFVTTSETGQLQLTPRFESVPLSTTRGFGIFFDKAGETTPIVFSQFVLKLTAMPEVIVFFHLRPLETPSVAPENRHTVSRLAIPNCYRLVVRYGYNDEIITPDLSSVIVDQVRGYLIRHQNEDYNDEKRSAARTGVAEFTSSPIAVDSATPNGHPDEQSSPSSTENEQSATSSPSPNNKPIAKPDPLPLERRMQAHNALETLEAAYAHQTLYIMGKEQMKIRDGTNIARRVLLSAFLWIRENTRNKMASLKVPTDRVVEVGFLKDI